MIRHDSPLRMTLWLAACALLFALAFGPAPAATAPAWLGKTLGGHVALKSGSVKGFQFSQCLGILKGPAIPTGSRTFEVEANGGFTIPNVMAGKYTLVIYALEKPRDEYRAAGSLEELGRKNALASLTRQIDVPAPQVEGEPLNLGTLELWVTPALIPGKPAPDFKVPAIGGGEVSLGAARGKYLLLVFWATWCPYCVKEIPDLKALHAEFGKDPRFMLLGLSKDTDMDKLKSYVQEKSMSWPQGFLGQRRQDKVSQVYGIRSIPTLVLIGPDGKVIHKDSSVKPMRLRLAAALGKPAASPAAGK